MSEETHKKASPLGAIFLRIFLLLAIFGLGVLASTVYFKKQIPLQQTATKDKYITLMFEVYDKINQNYWDKISEEQLVNLYVLGTEKLTGQPQILKKQDKANLEKMLNDVLAQLGTDEKKKEYTVQLSDMVLANLAPFGRSRLYTQKDEKELANTVHNISETNQYEVLGIKKDATQDEIKKNYEQKAEELKNDKSAEATEKLAQVNKAYQVLKDQEARKVYDTSGIEPTADYKLLRPTIFYMKIAKMSPTTTDELKRNTEKVNDTPGLDTLILDLRDNIGGSIDSLPYFLGPFIGNDQYAFQFYHQGEKTDYKTRIGWLPSLVRYKKVIVLINENSQSSAEVVAATLKKYNVGVLVGTTSKGWGTVERVFPLDSQLSEDEKYSMFLVHSLTLREDGQPIQDKGVEPHIDIKKAGWEKELFSYFNSQEIVDAVKEVL